ncbi:MAG: tRNA (adenosine(37)-N6)-threonylcarbamoyltransferase complex transferase subunit TsaD [Planctomycetaceae bacterium]|nr:tRNA (adenosine(37)-N6)-threonylcarbamoyltransferase complex transferase subunit TsaD [Planctomycetaceae bacterium]
MRLLTLETTCDETAAAVIDERRRVLGAVVASQETLHARYGGVVPEIASRAHVERILPVIDEALRRASLKIHQIEAVAVATSPGLAGSLLVGLAAAKALAVGLRVPLVAVNHVQAHLYACQLADGPGVFPAVGLVVSGGHTNLYECQSPLEFKLLGSTIDDAAGEAFDKVASLLGLEYPGGPPIERAARRGRRDAHPLPRAFFREDERLEFSFSGLKTAVRYRIAPAGTRLEDAAPLSESAVADLAASFQEAVVDVLVDKCRAALARCGLRSLCVGGGVAVNGRLRERLQEFAAQQDVDLHLAPPALCTDNAVMGAIALERLEAGLVENLDLDVLPGLERG